MNKESLIKEIKASQEFFNRSTSSLTEEDSNFAPTKEMLTVAQQVLHTAHTINWFLDGAFSATGFDMDWEKHAAEYKKTRSLKEAREEINKAYKKAINKLEICSEQDLQIPIAQNPIMGGDPRTAAFVGIIEHTAHHRGALTVYARLLNKVPPMPYMDS